MSELVRPAPPTAPPPPAIHEPRVPGWAAWFLRILVLLTTILVFLQAVYAGLFVTGEVGMLALHAAGPFFITAVVFAQIIAAFLVWRPGRGPAWPILASVGFMLLIWVQMTFGYLKLRAAHVPLGALLFSFALLMVVGIWSPRFRERQPRRCSAGGSE